jgi:phosphoglycerol transferase MdoB-like AlkP superfamily enzyme
MLSIIPGVSTCSYRSATNTYLPYQFGLSFKDYNYNTLAFHGWTYTYYNRDELYPNLGYTYYGYDRYHTHYKYALEGIHDSWPTSDVDVVNAMYPYLQNEDRNVAYMMSISGHLEYSFSGNDISKKNKSLVSNMNASDSIKAYMAANIEFDKSMELLLQKLEEDGKINDTVIVIAADHYPYGLTYEEIKAYDPTVQNKTFDLYKNQLIIYNPELKETHITKNIYSIDVLPTILNMFGISYDSRLLIGKDIMSDSSDLVIFNDKSWITDKGRYDYIKKSFEKTTDEELPSNYVQEINDIVNMKMQMSKLIISKDYYRKVLGK